MSTRLVAWRDEGIWTWASLYILAHKADYLTCKTTRNNHVKAAFYKNLYQAYIDKGNFTDARTSRSLRDLVSDRGKLCRYINELADMRGKNMDLSWVSKQMIKNLDELLKLMPNPKQRTTTSPKASRQLRTKLQCKNMKTIEPLPVTDSKISLHKLTQHDKAPAMLPSSLHRQQHSPPPSPQPDQWITLNTNFMRPLCYQMLVSIPDGTVIMTSPESRKALGYDMTGMHFNSTLVVCDNPKDTPNVLEMVQSVVNLHNMWIKSGATKIPIVYRRKIRDVTKMSFWVEAYGRIVRWDIDKTIVCIMERNVTDAVLWGRNPERAEVKMARDIHFDITDAARHESQTRSMQGTVVSLRNHEVPPPIMPHLLPPPLVDAPSQLPPMPPLKSEETDDIPVTNLIKKLEEPLPVTPKVPTSCNNSNINRFTFADPPSLASSFGEWIGTRTIPNAQSGWDSSSVSPSEENTIRSPYTQPQAEGRFVGSPYSRETYSTSPLLSSSDGSSSSPDLSSSPAEGRISPIQLSPPDATLQFKFSSTDARPTKRQRIQSSVSVVF